MSSTMFCLWQINLMVFRMIILLLVHISINHNSTKWDLELKDPCRWWETHNPHGSSAEQELGCFDGILIAKTSFDQHTHTCLDRMLQLHNTTSMSCNISFKCTPFSLIKLPCNGCYALYKVFWIWNINLMIAGQGISKVYYNVTGTWFQQMQVDVLFLWPLPNSTLHQ